MTKNKRPRDDGQPINLDDVHPSRKKRVKYTEQDAKLAQIYDNLADEVQAVRIGAASDLLRNLSTDSVEQWDRIQAAQTRLLRGLCSGRKAARLGFSIALTEVFRLLFSIGSKKQTTETNLTPTINHIVSCTTLEGNVSGQERRDYLLGRRFAFQALLQSDVGLSQQLSDSEWRAFMKAAFDLAVLKPWLRRECGVMFYDYLTSPNGAKLSNPRVQIIVEALSETRQLRTAEGVALWVTIQRRFPDVVLPKGIWSHKDPFSSKERDSLAKAMLDTPNDDDPSVKASGSRQSTPSFAWRVILSELYQRENDKYFTKFWKTTVVSSMFSPSSSTERRSLGLQVVSLALSDAPNSLLPEILDANILRCILDQRASPERYLFDAAKGPLHEIIARAKGKPEIASNAIFKLVDNGAPNFDQLTKTKTVETLLSVASEVTLAIIADGIGSRISSSTPGDSNSSKLADILLIMVRLHKHEIGSLFEDEAGEDVFEGSWLGLLLQHFAVYAYDKSSSSNLLYRSKLMASLRHLMDGPIEQASKVATFAVIWTLENVRPVDEEESPLARDVLPKAKVSLEEISTEKPDKPGSLALSLLLSLSILEVLNEESDAANVVEDVMSCIEAKDQDGIDSNTVLVELLLSFVSKPSALFRKIAQHVFTAFTQDLTADGLQSMVEILSQKESLSGQRELFDQEGEGENRVDSGEDQEGDDIDVEDASDVELVNGYEQLDPEPDEQGGTDESVDSSEAESGANEDDDEEAAFDKKLAEALGTTGGDDQDSDDDGSDMDDEQMMALEPHLTSIFKERQNKPNKKQEKKDARENIVNFKNRVLELLTIYMKSQYANILTLDLILPLSALVRTTSSKPTAERAYALLKQYFDACSKNKKLPILPDAQPVFDLLAAIHTELKLDGSKLHANTCSRSSLFLSKVLVAMDQKHYEQISKMYAGLQSEWYQDPKSKIPGSVFTEFTSWSITTRKNNSASD